MSDPTTSITLELPEEFLRICEVHDITPEIVLRGFIADLSCITNWADNPRADGYSSHGSDERRLAWDWFDRVGYPYRGY